MKRLFMTPLLLVSILLVSILLVSIGACDKPPADQEPEPPIDPQKTAEPAIEAPPTPPAENPESALANLPDDQFCTVAHSDTVKLVEGIKASMKKTGQEDPSYAAPEQATYVGLCHKLPLTMQKCLVIAYSMQHKSECQATLEGLNPEARATYNELMGK